MAAEEEPPSEFYDINRDEKNVIFQLLIMLVIIIIVACLILSPVSESVEFIEAFTNWLFIISTFFKDLVLISYVDERVNLNFLF
jgi:hypothetical protein